MVKYIGWILLSTSIFVIGCAEGPTTPSGNAALDSTCDIWDCNWNNWNSVCCEHGF